MTIVIVVFAVMITIMVKTKTIVNINIIITTTPSSSSSPGAQTFNPGRPHEPARPKTHKRRTGHRGMLRIRNEAAAIDNKQTRLNKQHNPHECWQGQHKSMQMAFLCAVVIGRLVEQLFPRFVRTPADVTPSTTTLHMTHRALEILHKDTLF